METSTGLRGKRDATVSKTACVFLFIVCSMSARLTTAQTECKTKADVVFMVDSSTSIREFEDTEDNWQIIKTFIVNVTKQLPISEDAVRVGVVKFSTDVDEMDRVLLGHYENPADLYARINALKFVGGGTNTAAVLRHVYTDTGFLGTSAEYPARPGAQRFAILITDGLSNIQPNMTKPAARAARLEHNIKLFTLGITAYANVDELQEIASDPVSHYYFLSPDFSRLNLLIDELLLGICREKPPPSAPCVDGRADIAFILDASGSIGENHWNTLKQFVVAVIDELDLSAGRSRVAVVRYSTTAEVVFTLCKYFDDNGVTSVSDMRSEILDMSHVDERTNIAAALRVTRETIYQQNNGDRPDIKNIAILISDGFPTDEVNETLDESRLMHEAGVTMFALGLTTAIDEAKLRTIASAPTQDHYFNATSVSHVGTLRSRLVWGVCSDRCADGEVLDAECRRNMSSYGCRGDESPRWIPYPGRILLGHNYDRLENIPTAADCQRLCNRDPQCRSVDYVPSNQQCAVSYVTKDTAPDSFVQEPSANYYELSCSTFGQGPTAPPMGAPGGSNTPPAPHGNNPRPGIPGAGGDATGEAATPRGSVLSIWIVCVVCLDLVLTWISSSRAVIR